MTVSFEDSVVDISLLLSSRVSTPAVTIVRGFCIMEKAITYAGKQKGVWKCPNILNGKEQI